MATYEFTVTVKTQYLPEQSAPDQGRHVFSYTIRVVNTGTAGAQLISRHWVITDARGHVEEVRGSGVIGEQPVIAPGESYSYASGCPLTTPSGSMVGAYSMTDGEGRVFEAAIPAFSLDIPDGRRTLN